MHTAKPDNAAGFAAEIMLGALESVGAAEGIMQAAYVLMQASVYLTAEAMRRADIVGIPDDGFW